MKKLISVMLATLMAVSLVGCSSSKEVTSGEASNASVNTNSDANSVYPDDDGYAEGRMGDVMHTCFFDYTVNSAYLCDQYEGYTAAEGYELLVAEVSVKNTFSESITMYDSDFQVQWNDESEEAYDYPITYYLDTTEVISDEILPYEYDLKVNRSQTGLLIFEVPEGNTDFSISYLEYFDDDTTGDVFFVFFSAEKENGNQAEGTI